MIMFPTIPRYFTWTPQDTTLPQLYWNVYSNEKRIHAICRELGKVIRYADMMGVEVSNIAKALNDIQEGKLDEFITTVVAQWFEDNQPEIMQDIADINALIGDGFTSENTVKAAIEAVNDDMDTFEQRIGEQFNEFRTETTNLVEEKVDNVERFISKSDYLPVVTAGWLSMDSGYHSTAAGDTKPWILAGMTTKGNNQIYAVFRYNNSENAAIYRMNIDTNSYELIKDAVKVGHANDMSYSPVTNNFYILPGQSNIDNSNPDYQNVLFEYNSTFTSITERYCPESWGAMGYDHVTGKLTLAGYGGGVYDFDETTHTFVQREVTLDPTPGDMGFIGQGGGVYDNMAYFALGWNGLVDDNLISVYDLETGKLVKTYLVPLTSDIFPVGEVQDISFTEKGVMYLANSAPFERGQRGMSLNVFFKSGVVSDEPFGHFYSSLVPDSVRVEPLNTQFKPRPVGTQLVFRTINEALSYARYHSVKSIILYPSKTTDTWYWFHEIINLEGMGEIVIETPKDKVGIEGGIYVRGGTTLRWNGVLNVAMPYNLNLGTKIGLYLLNSTFIGTALTVYPGKDPVVRYGMLMEGVSMYFGTSAPYLTSSVTGTAWADNSTGGGHKFTKFNE